MAKKYQFDVLIIGSGAAGLMSAIQSGLPKTIRQSTQQCYH